MVSLLVRSSTALTAAEGRRPNEQSEKCKQNFFFFFPSALYFNSLAASDGATERGRDVRR